jgi:tRNA threonylcarbamoyladenosine biosynthesis protein TsaE
LDTQEIAAAVASVVIGGDTILLQGELGTGKTAFVRAFCAAIQTNGDVTSPTYTLVHNYSGPYLAVVHADVYRCSSEEEIALLSIDELVSDDSVLLVEWGDRFKPLAGPTYCEVSFDVSEVSEGARRIAVELVGNSWLDRARSVEAALKRWSAQ